ncbi:hypothetical protein B0T24DRAFT_691352 [Lasiosphaeria ovina]|uniref:HNH nuclease domain-containing protein n=1 Tax=Lasiosphaeria ovina TaxID=92902 RepID=A0AAE0MYA4_9PEZI|nr:hypothetical protein B0T24DRAFT_691352 [Lasiosphaeria ovina]
MNQVPAVLKPEQFEKICRAVVADPDRMWRLISDIPPASEPVEDYITDVGERCGLLRELRLVLASKEDQDEDEAFPINTTIFAIFMVAPLAGLRAWVELVRTSPHGWLLAHGVSNRAPIAMRDYLPRKRKADTPLSAPPAAATSVADERDDPSACAFSGYSDPVAASIFPPATARTKKFRAISEVVRCFWGAERAETWSDLAYELQSPANSIAMNRQLRLWFGSGARFALKPLRQRLTDDGYPVLDVQWHWLRRAVLRPRALVHRGGDGGDDDDDVTLLLTQAGLAHDCQSWGTEEVCLAYRPSGVPISTGQVYTLRGDRSILPNFDLMRMHWDLLRVADISGVANIEDDCYELDDEECYYDPVVVARQETVLDERDGRCSRRRPRWIAAMLERICL